MKGHRLLIAEQTLLLLPSGAVFWEEQTTLFVADLHLGKATTFRRGGIPIPAGATRRTIDLLTRCVNETQPSRLIVLGDLVHARCSWDDELLKGLSGLVDRFEKGFFQLIEGNHDRGSRNRWQELSIQLLTPPHALGPWMLLHDESIERLQTPRGEAVYLAGHLHPAITLNGSGEAIRLRCFRLLNNCLTLAAFGAFTGSKRIDDVPGQRIFAIADNDVIPI